jgi:molybdopterin-guanine dinucleotide biosynthesis protein A
VDVAILAGGRARRLGGVDKSALRIGSVSIFERQLAALEGLADRIVVVGGGPGRLGLGRVRVVPDRVPRAGALGGLYTALCEATTPYVLVLACDLPFVSARVVGRMAALADGTADAVVPRTTDGVQPLCAVYARRLRNRVRRHIESGHLKVQDLLAGVRVRELGPDDLASLDPTGHSFFNVNTPGDLGRAVRFAARANRHARR